MEKIEIKAMGYKMTQCRPEKNKGTEFSIIKLPPDWEGKDVLAILMEE